MIPEFTSLGTLPPGEHPTTWPELLEHFGQTAHRAMLLGGLRAGLEPLRLAGSHRVWLDGSFTTSKEKPGDIDIAYDDTNLDWEMLQRLEPTLLDFTNARFRCSNSSLEARHDSKRIAIQSQQSRRRTFCPLA